MVENINIGGTEDTGATSNDTGTTSNDEKIHVENDQVKTDQDIKDALNLQQNTFTHDKAFASRATSAYQQQSSQGATLANKNNEFNNVSSVEHEGEEEENITPVIPISQKETQELKTQVAFLKDQLARALAEQENIRKRMSKEAKDLQKYAASKFASSILAVADNLRRAVESVKDESKEDAAVKNLVEGVELTEKELMNAFEKHNIIKVDPLNEKFDPNLHEAIFQVPGDEQSVGLVKQVVQCGYKIDTRILRPARVGVGVKAESTEEE